MDAPLDLEAYLARIGWSGPRVPTRAVLESLHRAHLAAIPFENVDVRLGRPIRLDLASVQAKLVGARRGGYCFEQNTLFAAALRALGFRVETLEARVRPPGAAAPLPRTHMVLRVDAEGADLLADVGFGGDGPLLPVPLDGTVAAEPGGGAYRVVEDGALRVLQSLRAGAWTDLYAFLLLPAHPIDYEVANHYTSTHPASRFVLTLTVQRSTAEARHVLRGRTYTVRRGEEEISREIKEEEAAALLREIFRLDLDPGEVRGAFRDADGP